MLWMVKSRLQNLICELDFRSLWPLFWTTIQVFRLSFFFCLQINSLSHVCVMRVCTRTPPTPIFTLRRTMAPFFISWDFSNQRPIKKRGEPRFRTTCQLKVGSAAAFFFGFVFIIVPWHIKTTKRTKHHQRQKFCHTLELRNFLKKSYNLPYNLENSTTCFNTGPWI